MNALFGSEAKRFLLASTVLDQLLALSDFAALRPCSTPALNAASRALAQAPDADVVEIEAVRLAGFQGFDEQLALRDLGQELRASSLACIAASFDGR
jgi:hypothetical protein